VIGVCLLLVSSGGCDPNVPGRYAALRRGAVSDVKAERLSFDAELRRACADNVGAALAASSLMRQPYLQQVQDDSLQILWTATSKAPYTVDVSLPSGDRVASVQSAVDLDAHPEDAYQHVVEVGGLQPDQIYCYTIRNGDDSPMLARTGFRTAPLPGKGAPVAFVAWGDSGYGGLDQRAVASQLKTVKYDLILHTGDVAYDDGTRSQFESNFFAIYEPMLASVPSYPVSGNHDYHSDGASPFLEVLSLPENGGPEGRERWYSFDWGDVHFVALDTERVNEAQIQWLEEDLAANDLPWTIVYTHMGPYSSGPHGSNTTFRDAFGDILRAHGVQLVLSGHDHCYERTVPIDGITYVVTGGGGRGVRRPGSSSFTAFSHDVLHFVYVTIDGPELRLYAIDATGKEFDFTRIVNPAAG
jgi:hypothetical protein